jgi:hypothetical protein
MSSNIRGDNDERSSVITCPAMLHTRSASAADPNMLYFRARLYANFALPDCINSLTAIRVPVGTKKHHVVLFK